MHVNIAFQLNYIQRERLEGRFSAPSARVYMQSTRLKEHLYYCLLKAAETLSYIIQRHHY